MSTLKATHLPFPCISYKLDALVNRFHYEDIYLTKADKTRKDNKLLKQSLADNMDEADDILDIDSWFDDEIQSRMIFIFIFCIIALIAFLFLLFLCYKYEKLRKILSFYLTSSITAEAPHGHPFMSKE